MVRLHELALGDTFEDLLVEVWQLEGVDPASKPRDPVYSALVRDPSGYCRLIYRANNNCKPSNVKRGKFYRISGRVSSYRGRVQIQIGSSWGRVEKVNGDEFVCTQPYSPATDLSAIERWYGALVIHASGPKGGEGTHRLRAFVLSTSNRQLSKQQQQHHQQQQQQQRQRVSGGGGTAAGLLPTPSVPVPCTTAAYMDTERGAAQRALRDVLSVAPDVVRILPLPPVLHVQPASGAGTTADGGAPAFWHIFAAVLQASDEDLKYVFGEPCGGTWVGLDELTAATGDGRVPTAWRAPLSQLITMVRTAQAAGLIELHLPQGSSSTVAAPAPAPAPPAVTATPAADAASLAAEAAPSTDSARRLLPVTLLSGFLGAGKTTLLRHILTNREPNMRCAVVVNDMAELNIDAALINQGSLAAAAAATTSAAVGGAAVLTAAPERLVQLQNGCICCTLRGDLVQQIAEIAADGRFDYCVVESTGIGEPMQVAETFEFPLDGSDPAAALALEAAAAAICGNGDGDGDATAVAAPAQAPRRLADVARLDTCVTVVDASNLLENLHSLETLKERQESERVHMHGGGRRDRPHARARVAATADAAGSRVPAVPSLHTHDHDCTDGSCEGSLDIEDDLGDDEDDDEELERNVADLLLDQLEFADVILLNKVDTVPTDQLPRLRALVAAINPSARLLSTIHAEVPLWEVLNTGRFSLERAREGAGWLKAIREGTDLVPETAEYGITSFVWRSRRPFHPARLHAFMSEYFMLQQPDWSMADGGDRGNESRRAVTVNEALVEPTSGATSAANGFGSDMAAAASKAQEAAAVLAGVFRSFNSGGAVLDSGFSIDKTLQAATGAAAAAVSAASAAAAAAMAAAAAAVAATTVAGTATRPNDPQILGPSASACGAANGSACALGSSVPAADPATVAAAKGAARTAAFGHVLRSKGFVWVSGRDDHVGEWSSAGNLMRFGTGGPWYDVLPREAWPSEPGKVAEIEKDFLPVVGDRRQELVFIGIDMLRDRLVAALEACLATPEEEADIKRSAAAAAAASSGRSQKTFRSAAMTSLDPFLPWPDIQEIMDAGDDEDEELEDEDAGEQECEEDGDIEKKNTDDDIDDGEEEYDDNDGGPAGRWEPGVVLDDISDGAAELQQLLDETDQPSVVVLWHAPWAAASREAQAGLAALAARHPQLVFVRLDLTASQANEALAVSSCKLIALPSSRRSDARPTLRDGSKWPALTLHRPPGLRHEAYFAGPTALAELRSELQRRQSGWTTASSSSNVAANSGSRLKVVVKIPPGIRPARPHDAVLRGGKGDVGSMMGSATTAATANSTGMPLRRRQTTDCVPATPAKPTISVSTATAPVAAAPPSSATIAVHPQVQQRLAELRRGAADLKAHLLEARDAACPLVVAWLGAPPPNYPSTPTASMPSVSGGTAVSTTLATPPTLSARRAVAADATDTDTTRHLSIPPQPSYNHQDGVAAVELLLELSEQEQATLRVDVAAACKQYGAAVRVLFADPGVSAANRALAEALRVATAPTLQVYTDMKMVRSLKGPAGVGKLALVLAEVAPPSSPSPKLTLQSAASVAPPNVSSQPLEASPSGTSPPAVSSATALEPIQPQPQASIYDPPTGKYGKPGVRKQFGPRGRGVYWPRMPCLRCGCPWWLGEDWDAECVRCGWDCEADGYDDDSNPLPAFKAKYDVFVATLQEGRTSAWKGKHVGPHG